MSTGDGVRRWWRRIVAPGWIRPTPTAAQRRTDIRLVAVFFVIAPGSAVVATSLAGAYGRVPPAWWWYVLWIVVLGLPLVWRRRYPITSMLLVATAFLVSQWFGYPDNLVASVALFWSLYSVGAWSQRRVAAFWARVIVVAGMFASIVISFAMAGADVLPDNTDARPGPLTPYAATVLSSLLINIVYFASSAFFGTVAWTSARRESQLVEQAAALAAAERDTAARAVTRERLHIARELHDVVAHHVSVMGVQASAARRVLGKSPDLATDALTAVENTARVAITELRELLGVLREEGHLDDAPMPPDAAALGPAVDTLHGAPGVDQIPALVAQSEKAGLKVGYGVFGDPRPIPVGVSLSLFRIVQEALTNVLKHAPASRVDVRLRYRETSVEVEITDDGSSAGSWTPRSGASTGYGLVGMRERVAVHGGELVVGPREAGGFRVRANLPAATVRGAGEPATDRGRV
ncbi:MAG: sensor histidine kinase [Nakamurella sp.]